MYRIDLENLVKNKINICKEYHIQPSELDRLIYFEYEWILTEINKQIKEEEKRREQEEKTQHSSSVPNYNSMLKQAQSSMPNMNNFSLPKVNMPKF